MEREEIHKQMEELIDLIQINQSRLYLNESSSKIDIMQLRSHVMDLYTCIDQLELTGPKEDKKQAEVEARTPEAVAPVIEEVQPIVEKTAPKFKPAPAEEPPVEEEALIAETAPKPEADPLPVIATNPISAQPPKIEVPVKKQLELEIPGNAGDSDVYAQLRSKKLDSIKKGIGIGKRYEIQKELFANSPDQYNDAIKQIDSADDLKSALDKLEEFAQTNSWPDEHPLVEELLLLLQRRHI